MIWAANPIATDFAQARTILPKVLKTKNYYFLIKKRIILPTRDFVDWVQQVFQADQSLGKS